jgi:hypothetical protein
MTAQRVNASARFPHGGLGFPARLESAQNAAH